MVKYVGNVLKVMVERLTPRQENIIKKREATFLGIEKVVPRDLGVISNPDLFPKDKKKDRRYNRAVLHAKQELSLLHFFLDNMRPYYRNQIMQSDEFQGVIRKILDVQGYVSSDQTDLEKQQSIAIALQMLSYSLTTLTKSMPEEFRKTLQDSAKPFVNMIEAISEYGRKNNQKDIPRINIVDIFYDTSKQNSSVL